MSIEPLELKHSWPLFELERRFDQGLAFDPQPIAGSRPAPQTVWGHWLCRLDDNALTWSAGIYDLFGLPRHAALRRDDTVRLYAEPSRAIMERLRAHAIRHKRGFTMDAEIVPASGPRRWMRLTAAPVIEGGKPTRLLGLKADVTHLYCPA